MRKQTQELRGYKQRPETVPLSEGPSDAWLWVLRAGLTPERATDEYGICWIPKYDRILLPVLERGVDTGGFVARSLVRGVPKYVASASAQGKHWSSPENGSGLVVVTEDILSAIAVHRAGYMAFAGMGTSFPVETMVGIQSLGLCVVLWLDPDAGGTTGIKNFRRAARQWPITVLPPVKSEHDPKRHSATEIRRYIETAKGTG